jgi:hypothetical protein
MLFEKGSPCPYQGCRGVLQINKSCGKNIITCDCHPTRHYAVINQPQAAAWERGEAIEIEDFPREEPQRADRWILDRFYSQLQKVG